MDTKPDIKKPTKGGLQRSIMRILLVQPGPIYFGAFILIAMYVVWEMPKNMQNWLNLLCYSPASWTFQEYCAHRWLMHELKSSIRTAHFSHHKEPMHLKKIFIPILLTLLFATGNALPIYYIWGTWPAAINLASSILCYCSFELIHYSCHCVDKKSLLGVLMTGPRFFHARHHVLSTDKLNQQNYGFTSATWDILFGYVMLVSVKWN